MKEIEILVQVLDSKEQALKKLESLEFDGKRDIYDIYYYDPLRSNLKPNSQLELNACLIVRQVNQKYFLIYKLDHFDEFQQWSYADEWNTEVKNSSTLIKILDHLGLKPLLTLKNTRYVYQSFNYQIVLEEVQNLGLFLAVKYQTDSNQAIRLIKENLKTFLHGLGLHVTEELHTGKAELMLQKIVQMNQNR